MSTRPFSQPTLRDNRPTSAVSALIICLGAGARKHGRMEEKKTSMICSWNEKGLHVSVYECTLLHFSDVKSTRLEYRFSRCLSWGRGGVGWGGGGGGVTGIILVRVCEPVLGNLPHSYTWPLEKTDPFIY